MHPKRLREGLPDPGTRVGVVSPHCDDAVLSLGAMLAAHVRRGGRAVVVTPLAGDLVSQAAVGPWDRAAGFKSQQDATAARRAEDVAACRVLGVEYYHVDEVDEQYPRRRRAADLWEEIRPVLTTCDEILLPGYPLLHADHLDLTTLVLRRLDPVYAVRLYYEEPYALRERIDLAADRWKGLVSWRPLRATRRDVMQKLRAVRCYRSQLPLLGPGRLPRPSAAGALVTQVQLWRAARGRGEYVSAPIRGGTLSRCLP